MSRVPVRVRLTAAFAVAMALVLVGAGLFVYERLRNDLDESVTAGLVVARRRRRRRRLARGGRGRGGEEGFAQVLGAGRAACSPRAGRIRGNVP